MGTAGSNADRGRRHYDIHDPASRSGVYVRRPFLWSGRNAGGRYAAAASGATPCLQEGGCARSHSPERPPNRGDRGCLPTRRLTSQCSRPRLTLLAPAADRGRWPAMACTMSRSVIVTRWEEQMTRNSFTRGVVLATLAVLGTVGAAAAQPGFPATSFLTPAQATWESTRKIGRAHV